MQQNAIRSVAQIIHSSHGVLWTQTGAGRFAPLASWPRVNENVSHLPTFDANDELVAFMLRTKWVVDLTELARRPELYDRMQVHVELRALADGGLIVPLFHGEELYGFLLLARAEGQGELTFEDRDLLKTVGRHLAVHLWQADMDRSLAESRQFETFNRFAAFVMHDLKNSIAQLRLVVQNAERHKRNPQFVDDAMSAIAHTVDRMGRLLTQLSQDAASGAPRTVDLAQVAERAALRVGRTRAGPAGARDRAAERARGSRTPRGGGRAHPAQCAGRDAGRWQCRDHHRHPRRRAAVDRERLRVAAWTRSSSASGCSARSIDQGLASGMGIGAYQAREYLRSVGGDVEVTVDAGAAARRFRSYSPPRQPNVQKSR